MTDLCEVAGREVTDLLAECAEWRLFGLLFEYPAHAWRSNLESLLPALPRSDLRGLAQAALEHSSEGLQIALFGPGGTVPVREVARQVGVQSGYLMAELSAYYEAFGYQPEVEEAADHLAIQLGFVAFLKMKQALALFQGNSEHARLTAEAADAFIKDHLAVQAEPVYHALESHAPSFLVEAGRLILQHAGLSPRSGYPWSTSLPEDDDQAMSCGPAPGGDDLIQLRP